MVTTTYDPERNARIEIIFNGGNPLGDCPTTFSEADQWAEDANTDNYRLYNPVWKFDCGFKLDYDGPLVSISSRFFPPKGHYGPKWNGTVDVLLLGEEMQSKPFECDSLEELRSQVEAFKEQIVDRLKAAFTNTNQQQTNQEETK